MGGLNDILTSQWRLLTFRQTIETVPEAWKGYLAYVLVVTWIVGVGRYWDSPSVAIWQRLGIGSVVYLVAMSAYLLLVISLVARRAVPFLLVLIFIGMTSLPAILYAIPVEKFMPMGTAAKTNFYFLTVIAIWRLSLLACFIRKVAGLPPWGVFTATFLPLAGIMIVLASLSLEHVTFGIMSGMIVDENHPRSLAGQVASDVAAAVGLSHGTTHALSILSWMMFPFLLIAYVCLLARKHKKTGHDDGSKEGI